MADGPSKPGDVPPLPGGDQPGGAAAGEPSPDDRLWAMLAHLSGLVLGAISGATIGFIGALVIWLVKREESPFVNDQGKEALNFQLTILIMSFACWAIGLMTCILLPLVLVPYVLLIVFSVIAAIKANEGVYYRYPLNIRFFT